MIIVRVTDEEKKQMESLAKKSQLRFSSFIRLRLGLIEHIER
jgi:hypothetical protein